MAMDYSLVLGVASKFKVIWPEVNIITIDRK